TLFRRFQNLRQKDLSIEEYTNEFYKLSIRVEQGESEEKKATRYINGLSYTIQDELSMLRIHSLDDAYQLALKAKEKNKRSNFRRGVKRGPSSSPMRGRGRFESTKGESSNTEGHEDSGQSHGNYQRGRGFQRGR
ncbi:hypothetical protein KI387_008746, partial [Taxus chinensis]